MHRARFRSVFVAYDEYGEASMTADECIEEDKDPEWTGLYDANGDELYRVRERIKFGFVKE